MLLRRLRHPEDLNTLEALFERCEESTGRYPLSEQKYRSLVGSNVFGVGFVVEESGNPVGYVHILESKRPGLYELETAIDPIAADQVQYSLLEAALFEIGRLGGDFACLWVYTMVDEQLLGGFGFRQSRSLHEMRTSLPVPPPPSQEGVDIRAFETGDEDALLALNNRAFLGHPEAGGWTVADLRNRQGYEWHDQTGIRMAWMGERLGAFCWTKEHPDHVGEIYLIATDPELRGRGLGRVIALEGLRYLFEAKGSRTGMLFADAGNQKAMRMYESIGFKVHQTSRAFMTSIDQSGV